MLPLGELDRRKALAELDIIAELLEQRTANADPVALGVPDLLRPKREDEDDAAFRLWQDKALTEFIESRFYFIKDGVRIKVRVIPEMGRFLCDAMFRRQKRLILWKPRGSGGSLAVGILVVLMMLYHKMSFILLAGSQKQSRIVYAYIKQAWECFPDLMRELFAKEPTITNIELKNGVVLDALPATEKAVRGEHRRGLIIDEAVQRDWSTDEAMRAALNATMSEPDHLIILVSTFHLPTGLFQSVWDAAKEKGFEQYKWSVFDAMAPCRKQIDCRNCYLTEPVPVTDRKGKVVKYRYTQCAGTARYSKGWKDYEDVAESKRINIGTNAFDVEFCCNRPESGHTVYNLGFLRRAKELCPVNQFGNRYVPWDIADEKCVGIDWGMHQTFLVLLVKRPEYIGVIAAAMFSNTGMREIIALLSEWERNYCKGKLDIYADSSHFFNNDSLHQQGFSVMPVPFVTYKNTMIENLERYLSMSRLRLHEGTEGDSMGLLWKQMNEYRRDRKGKPVKENDHGPDALSTAALHFNYNDHFSHLDMGGQGSESTEHLNVRVIQV